ncbi:phage tail protein [Pseudomonas sp. MWU13-3659]|uniref:phage tail protein n=1 Tax=Pseudomonas sp. MWU13-3659 TaxID=2986964 RepID=UPI0020761AA3|nr:phage tail protein [Pseudomonas sp. MWU13-3659]
MPWYRQGAVAITAGQTTVTGTGTNFALNARVGDAFQGPDGRWYEVANIASATVLSILPAYQGSTVASGSYALAPMQGYVKESADRLRQMVEQYGSTLALLGTPADVTGLRANIGAAARGANSDITGLSGLTTALSVAQGGTGGKTPAEARAGLNLGSAAIAAVVGEVSQSGGIPTGAIMQYITNAVGECWKFACGLMITSQTISVASGAWAGGGSSASPRYRDVGASLPATFIAVPRCIFTVKDGDIAGRAAWVTTYSATVSSATPWFAASPLTTGTGAFSFDIVAVGRWF